MATNETLSTLVSLEAGEIDAAQAIAGMNKLRAELPCEESLAARKLLQQALIARRLSVRKTRQSSLVSVDNVS